MIRFEDLKVNKSQNFSFGGVSGNILCLHDISIYTNFHQNRYINECARMILA